MNERAPLDSEVLGGLPGTEFPKGGLPASNETKVQGEKKMDQEVTEAIVQSRVKRGEKVDDIIQSLEQEMDEMEEKMKGKKGTQEWDDYAVMLNDKERQVQAAERIKAGGGQSGDTTFQTQQERDRTAKKRAEAFAWAKARAEQVRASYAKPVPVKPAAPQGFFSRVTGWLASLGRQREAGKKIAEALTPALREQRTPDEAVRKEAAAQNAAAYEARVFQKSRVKQEPSEQRDEAQSAK